MAKQTKIKKFELATLNVDQIVELDGWIEKRSTVIKESPFVVIDNPETYKTAKRNRTALKSFRTTVEKQDRTIGTFLSQFRKSTKVKSLDLVENEKEGTIHHENKQQIEIDRWEKIIQDEKDAEAKKEEARIETIKTKIESSKRLLKAVIDAMTFENSKEHWKELELNIEAESNFDFEEFDFLFDEMIEEKRVERANKINDLSTKESERLDQLSKDQKAKSNEIFVELSKAITDFDGSSDQDLVAVVEKRIQDLDFDFGDEKKNFDQLMKGLVDLAKKHVVRLKDEAEENQSRAVIRLREVLLDLVYQMDTTNHIEETKKIKEALEQPSVPVELAKDEFGKMIEVVNKALSRKLNEIAEDLQKLEDEKEEEAKKIEALRVKIIAKGEELGLKKVQDKLVGFGLDIEVNKIVSILEDEFDEWLIGTEKSIEAFKENDAKEQERKDRLDPERKALIDWIDNGIRKTSMSGTFKQPETSEFRDRISSRLNSFCDELIEELKSI